MQQATIADRLRGAVTQLPVLLRVLIVAGFSFLGLYAMGFVFGVGYALMQNVLLN